MTDYFYCVSGGEVFQAAEEAVAVTGDGYVAGVAGERGSGDVAYSAVEGEVVGALEDGDFDGGFGDAEDSFWSSEGDGERALIGTDAGAVPEAVGAARGAKLCEGEVGHYRAVDGWDEVYGDEEETRADRQRTERPADIPWAFHVGLATW